MTYNVFGEPYSINQSVILVPQTNVIIEIRPVLLFTLYNTKNIAYHIMEELIFYADKLMVMGNSKNLHVFNFAILLKLRKSHKFDAREIYMFDSTQPVLLLLCNICISVSSWVDHINMLLILQSGSGAPVCMRVSK